MSVSAEDLERLTEFLDGTLDAAERGSFLARLDNEPALYELMLETRAVRAELAEEGEVREIDPSRWRRRAVVGALAAAALVAVLVAPRLLLPEPSLETLTDGLAASATQEAMAELVETPWSVMRGSEESQLDEIDSFRLGVRDVALRLALERGDAESAKQQADASAHHLAAAAGAARLSAEYERIAAVLADGTSTPTLIDEHARLVGLIEQTGVTVGPISVFGRFVRAAWLAAASGDADWFSRRVVRATVDDLESLAPAPLASPVRDALEPLTDGRATPEELERARRDLEEVLAVEEWP